MSSIVKTSTVWHFVFTLYPIKSEDVDPSMLPSRPHIAQLALPDVLLCCRQMQRLSRRRRQPSQQQPLLPAPSLLPLLLLQKPVSPPRPGAAPPSSHPLRWGFVHCSAPLSFGSSPGLCHVLCQYRCT